MSGLKVLLGALLFTLFYAGCAMFGQANSDIVPPTLIQKTPLPSPPMTASRSDLALRIQMVIGKEGNVLNAQLENSSGDAEWDSAAVKSILLWKYSPATLNGKPIQLRIFQLAHVVSASPLMMNISEIVLARRSLADSVYANLRNGSDFDSLARMYSISTTASRGGIIGMVDVHMFGEEIQDELQQLEADQFTMPLQVGRNFIIYRRLPAASM